MRTNLNITSHSGCDGTPDNSLLSMKTGLTIGADAAEVDVRLNKRGLLIISHDEDPEKEYRDHPLLAEAFDIIAANDKFAINCDIKEGETIPVVLELAAEKGISPDRLILTGSVYPQTLLDTPAILAESSVWINIEEVLKYLNTTGNETLKQFKNLIPYGTEKDLFRKIPASSSALIMETIMNACLDWGVKVLNMPYLETIVPLIPMMKDRGLEASVWTINEKERLTQLFNLGVLNVTTRNTALAVKVREGIKNN